MVLKHTAENEHSFDKSLLTLTKANLDYRVVVNFNALVANLYMMEDIIMKILRIISLAFLAITLFISIDLGLNYLNSTFIDMNDGIVCISFFKSFFGDDSWSVYRFFRAFSTSLWITFVVTLENIILACVHIYKKKQY